MKLTNLQLSVLSSAIIKKLKENAISSSKHDEIMERIKKEMNYKNVIQIVSKYEKLLKKRDDIQREISEISRNFDTNLLPYFPNSLKNLDKIVNDRVNRVIFENIPSKLEIESDIVLMSMEGSSDIFSKVLVKYGIED